MRLQNNLLDFNNQQFHIGLDVHKKRWSVDDKSNKMVLRNSHGFRSKTAK